MKTKKTPVMTRVVRVSPEEEITLTVTESTQKKDGYTWTTYMVQGWRENGRWQRRKFKKLNDASALLDRLQVSLLNASGAKHLVHTHLEDSQVRAAESAFERLGERYDLGEAVEFFLSHFCNPDFKIRLGKAKLEFLGAKEKEIRERSIRQLDSTLTQFETFVGNMYLHEVTPQHVDRYLRSLRARDGKERASRKTWNNYRADLSSFFSWCCSDVNRWIGTNPAASVPYFTPRQVSEGREQLDPEILSVKQSMKLMRYVEKHFDGQMIRFFALALFAGIRPGPDGELMKLARHKDRDKLIDLKRGVITIPPSVSKVRERREILIRPCLRAWLEKSAPEILPTNFDRMIKQVRKECGLSHDVLRHSFISYHVGAFRSVGEAALEGGNSEAIIKKHYLNLVAARSALAFWKLAPKGVKIGDPLPNNRIELTPAA